MSTSQIIKFNQSSNKDLHLMHQHQSITRPEHQVASKNTLKLSKFEPKFSNHLSHKSRLLNQKESRGEKIFQKYFQGVQDYVCDFKFENKNKNKTFVYTHSLKSGSTNKDLLLSTEYNMDSSRPNPWSRGEKINTDLDMIP